MSNIQPVAYRNEFRPSRFSTAAVAALALVLAGTGCDSDDEDAPPPDPVPARSAVYGGGFERTFFNPDETAINRETAGKLVPLWRFQAGAIITASPILAEVDLGDDGVQEIVFAPSWDGFLYAVRASDGSLLWSYNFKPHPGGSYPQAGSAAVVEIDGEQRVLIASGMTMFSLDARDGSKVWEFDAGTGCEDCDFLTERNEILSSPIVFEGVVFFGMDVNDFGNGKGGFYAIDARTGFMRWFFDLASGITCYPDEGDDIRRYDGYHTAAELGLPSDFFTTRRGCDHDRTGNACGSVWSSATIDSERRLVYTSSSNCDTDDDPETVKPPPPMPPYDEAIFALSVDGEPAWVWRPREIDNEDLAFGGVPNLFEIEFGGATREVVGVGGKDGTYYVLDRDGTNEVTGTIEPYWATNVIEGGDIGGIIASAAVGGGRVLFSTAIGTEIAMLQRPAAWALDANTGEVLWGVQDSTPSFAPTSAVHDVVFMGSIGGTVFGYDTATGEELVRLGVGGPASSPALIHNGRLYVGAGTGARGGSPAAIAFQTSLIPSNLSAFCIAGSDGCPELGSCDDGNPCTTDERGEDDACRNTNVQDGLDCTVGAFTGLCLEGTCILDNAICDDLNQCTVDSATPQGCNFNVLPDGTDCVVRDDAGKCVNGRCEPVE